MISKEQIKDQLLDCPSGRHCAFIAIDDKIGLKVYIHKAMRDRCFDWQSEAAEFEMAPIAMHKVDIGPFFCYVTEIADMEYKSYSHHERAMKIAQRRFKNIFGFKLTDMCSFNFGYIKRGRRRICVCIDWDISESDGLPQDLADQLYNEGDGPESWMDYELEIE